MQMAVQMEKENDGENMKRRHWLVYIRRFALVVFIVCMAELGREYYLTVQHKAYMDNLSSMTKLEEAEEDAEVIDTGTPDQMEKAEEPNTDTADHTEKVEEPDTDTQEQIIMDKFSELYAENSDLIGWISISGTVIDYPVVQCADNEFYLHHDFSKREDRYGCLYVKDIADVNTPGTNFVIYGHNMKDGTMFGILDQYGDESFYEKHRQIIFDTLYEERKYEIMSVFLSNANGDKETGFKYYQFYQADTEEEFAYFYDNIMGKSLYDTGVTAEFGDTFLTLSTCAYHEEDGRIVVVAKKTDDLSYE